MAQLSSQSWGLHWFRRDLRVAGNSSLGWSLKEHKGRVVGVFCLDQSFLQRDDFSPNRFAFFLATLRALKDELQAIGSDLWVVDCQPEPFFSEIHQQLSFNAFSTVSFNRDYEPFARRRDDKVSLRLRQMGVTIHTDRDHLLVEPHEITKPQGEFYQVYSPFSRRWLELSQHPQIQSRISSYERAHRYLSELKSGSFNRNIFSLKWSEVWPDRHRLFPDALASFERENAPKVSVPIPPAGSLAALHLLEEFQNHADHYGRDRDFPGLEGTSRFSVYLKNGSMSSTQVIYWLKLHQPTNLNESRLRFLKEIVWREFYYSILFHRPEVERLEFLPNRRRLNYENDQNLFTSWRLGLTGFPIVDAGMRQLNREGWMHNRVRMIVASFLTKDLLIDWRWGELYFMNKLLDGDLAPNNGGWQWSASTGCDPQPYFRIFNPTLQSQRFDPDGIYIRKYLPELATLSNNAIHEPSAHLSALELARLGYPSPIVRHQERKQRALAMFKRPDSGES